MDIFNIINCIFNRDFYRLPSRIRCAGFFGIPTNQCMYNREDTLRQLQAGGLEIASAREFPPSIEDAFIYLVQQKDGANGGK